MISGFATPQGTLSHAQEHPAISFGELNKTGLLVSQAGFGCYRVNEGTTAHEQALTKALLAGINLIDTSSNYADGGSERLVGTVLARLIGSGRFARKSVVVVSKGGYLQGENYRVSQERKHQGRPFKELVLYSQGLEYCIHPEFLEDQLSRSLERLQLTTLDFYLLHNPEYYLGWAKNTGLPLGNAREEYYRRIQGAFAHLEREVGRGRIQFYGVSSNTFPAPATEVQFTSLERLWAMAQSLSAQHHFRVIQLPMNLLETGAVTEKNQADDQCVIGFARDNRLGVLVNRPLNAIADNRLTRLAEVRAEVAISQEEISRGIDDLIDSEEVLEHKVFDEISLAPAARAQILEQLATGKTLKQHWRNIGSLERWSELHSQYFLPRIHGVMQFLAQRKDQSKELSLWMDAHQEKLEAVFQGIASVYKETAAQISAQIKSRVLSVDEHWAQARTLSQMALRALRSTDGVTTVLVGMRLESHVEDVLEELARPVEIEERVASWHKLHENQ